MDCDLSFSCLSYGDRREAEYDGFMYCQFCCHRVGEYNKNG